MTPGFSQFISGDCCTCNAYQYGSQNSFFRDSSVYLILNQEDGRWKENSFSRYSYTNGKLAETLGYIFNRNLLQRVESNLQIINYNPEQKNVERLHFRWNKDFLSWKESSRNITYYDKEKNISSSVYYKFNTFSNNWENSLLNESITDNKTFSKTNLSKKWDALSGRWIINSKNTCTDDLSKLQRTCFLSILNKEGVWETNQKTVYQYNSNMMLTEMFIYTRDRESDSWGNFPTGIFRT